MTAHHPEPDVKILHTAGGGLVVSLSVDAGEQAQAIVRAFLGAPKLPGESAERRRIARLVEDLRAAKALVEEGAVQGR